MIKISVIIDAKDLEVRRTLEDNMQYTDKKRFVHQPFNNPNTTKLRPQYIITNYLALI